MLPKRLNTTHDRLYMIGNPRGFGKSSLVAEFAYRRDDICAKNANGPYPSGPVLFTDFKGVKSADEAEEKIIATINPLFFRLIFLENKFRNKTGMLIPVYIIFILTRKIICFHHFFHYRRVTTKVKACKGSFIRIVS